MNKQYDEQKFIPKNEQTRPEKDDTIKVGRKLKVTFSSVTHDGLGIAKISGVDEKGTLYDEYPLFVMGGLPKEQGIVEITKLLKTYGYGNLLKVFPDVSSQYRVTPICKHYPLCGGCNIMHMNYEGQLLFKRGLVKDTLKKIGHITDVKVQPVIGMENPLYYRNKVQVPIGTINGKNVCGFYVRNSHTIIPLDECYIQPQESTEIIKFTKNLCNEFKYTGYDEKKHTGDLRHIMVRSTKDTSSLMVVLVATHEDLPNIDLLCKKLVNRFPKIVSVIINVNNELGNGIIGNKSKTVYGLDKITDTLCDYEFEISAESFYQVNHDQTEKLYQTAISLAKLKETDIIIDAYCGIGTIGIIASKYVKQVYSVEVVKEAIENAVANAKRNKIKNIKFVCNEAEKQIIKWQKEIGVDAIFIDPPRKGCDETMINTIIEMRIPKVIYISCDPATLARDLSILINTYQIEVVQPVDMFSQSTHIETIVYLTLK